MAAAVRLAAEPRAGAKSVDSRQRGERKSRQDAQPRALAPPPGRRRFLSPPHAHGKPQRNVEAGGHELNKGALAGTRRANLKAARRGVGRTPSGREVSAGAHTAYGRPRVGTRASS